MKMGSEMRELKNLLTDLICMRDFTGRCESISVRISSGKIGCDDGELGGRRD